MWFASNWHRSNWFAARWFGQVAAQVSAQIGTGHGWIRTQRRNYIVRGRRYLNLTWNELLDVLAREGVFERQEVKVEVRRQKPRPVPKTMWAEVVAALQIVEPYDDDEEAALLLL